MSLPSPQLLNAVVSDLAGGDTEILIPIKTLLAKPGFMQLVQYASSGKGDIEKASLMQQLQTLFSDPVVLRLEYFIDGFLGLERDAPSKDASRSNTQSRLPEGGRQDTAADKRKCNFRSIATPFWLSLFAASTFASIGLAFLLWASQTGLDLRCVFRGDCSLTGRTKASLAAQPDKSLANKSANSPNSSAIQLNPLIPDAPIKPFLASDAGIVGCSGRAGLREEGKWPETVFAVWDYGAISYRSPDGKSGDRKGAVVVNINGELRTFTYNEVVHFEENLGPVYMNWDIPGYLVELTYRADVTGYESQGGKGSIRLRSDTPGDSVSIPVRVDRGC